MRLPILMYHKVEKAPSLDKCSITVAKLEEQFLYLKNNNFNTIALSTLKDYILNGKPLPPKPILITFDDGYKNNYTNLYPLLVKYNLKANIFLVADDIQTDVASNKSQFLHIEDINKMHPNLVQFGLHTYNHKSYADLTIDEIKEDITKMLQRFAQLKIQYQPILAYTFGAYFKSEISKQKLLNNLLQQFNISIAFRIGNRINNLPIKNNFLLQRIDVTGKESITKFKAMCTFGKKWLPF